MSYIVPYLLNALRERSALADDVCTAAAPRRCARYHPYRRCADLLDDLDDLLYDREDVGRGALLRLADDAEDTDDVPRYLVARARQVGRRNKKSDRKAVIPADVDSRNVLAVDVDVQAFRPEELSVQVLRDQGVVVVEGHHEERSDEHGYAEHHLTRRFKLPDGVDPDAVTSRLSADGVLRVTAARKDALHGPEAAHVRCVPITRVDRPAVQDAVEDALQDAVNNNNVAKDKDADGNDELVRDVEA